MKNSLIIAVLAGVLGSAVTYSRKVRCMKALALLVALLMPSLALADDLTLRGLERGKAYTVEVAADGSVTVTPTVVKPVGPSPNPTPGPTPIPPVPSPLTPRAQAIQAEAVKVGDPTTAKDLAEVYRTVAKLGEDGTVKDAATLQKAATFAADTYLGPIKAPAWQKTRDVLAIQWSQVPVGSPVAAYSTLLREVGSGLDAVDLKKSISPETLKWILEFLLPLLLKLFGL